MLNTHKYLLLLKKYAVNYKHKKIKKNFQKSVDIYVIVLYNNNCRRERVRNTKPTDDNDGSIAQLGEHLPYKQRVTGSSPVVPTKNGPVVQLVSTPACHAGGRGFEPLPGRHFCFRSSVGRAMD